MPPSWEDMPGVAGMLYKAYYGAAASRNSLEVPYAVDLETADNDSLRYPIPQTAPHEDLPADKSLYIKDNIVEEAAFDPVTGEYVLTRRLGELVLSSRTMTMAEYLRYNNEKAIRDYSKPKAAYTPTPSSGLGG
ncbi:MAG: hypothetical protein K2O66_08130, partial [Bacteroidales bacterium]|nr:hypothetical protein [Bacteroidales bacterium]